MFEMPRIALLILVLFVYSVATTGFGFGFPAGGVVIQGLITGAVMGNIPLGFYLGGTYELMNIGLNPLGGSVVPNYNLGVVVGVAFGAATGSTDSNDSFSLRNKALPMPLPQKTTTLIYIVV